jgi:hypothetical protein
MTVKFTTEKEIDDFRATVAPDKKHPFVPRYTPSMYDSKGRLAEATKEFKEGCELYWKNSSFSFLDCSNDLRKNNSVICSVVQWFPRELKNAHPDFLNDSEEINEIMSWMFDKVLPSSEMGEAKLYEWIKYYLNPSEDDEWFYKWFCLKRKFSSIPKKYQKIGLFIEVINAYPWRVEYISNPYKLNFVPGDLFPLEYFKDIEFKLAHFNALKKRGELDNLNDQSDAKYVVSLFELQDTELGESLLKSKTPLTDYAKAIGAQPLEYKDGRLVRWR